MPITADPGDIDVLVVDDEKDVVEVVGHFLEEEGYTVHTAYDGEEALEKASGDVDLIVLATHGRTGFRRLALGSVTEQVVRQARCPVLAVKVGAQAGEPSRVGA